MYSFYKLALDKTYNKTYVTRKDSDQAVQPPCMARLLVHSSLDSLEAVEGTCNQRRLWSDCADAQADLWLHWSHKSYCRLSRALAHIRSVNIQGPVVQSVVSLTSSLRVISLTVLVDSIHNILIFFAEKMWVAFALQKLLTFFQQKISAYMRITQCKF